MSDENKPTTTQVVLVCIGGGLLFLTLPSLLSTIARQVVFFFSPPTPGNVPSWFETAGQFGDQFGMVTCVIAMIAAFFSIQTFLTQRQQLREDQKRSAEADKERHFFKLYDDFRESLNRERQIDSEPTGLGAPGTMFVHKQVIGLSYQMNNMPWFPKSAGADPEIVNQFCTTLALWNSMALYRMSEVALKFLIAFRYLDDIQSREKPGTYSLYYETMITSLHEDEMKVVCVFLVELFTMKTGKADMDMAKRVMNLYIKTTLGIELSEHEVIVAMCSLDSIMRKVAVVRSVGGKWDHVERSVANMFKRDEPASVPE